MNSEWHFLSMPSPEKKLNFTPEVVIWWTLKESRLVKIRCQSRPNGVDKLFSALNASNLVF